MGIQDDVKNGLCNEQYVLVRSAVKALAKATNVTQPEVARWLRRKNVCGTVWGYVQDDYGRMASFGRMDPRTKRISRQANAEGAKNALGLIESASGRYVLIYWNIAELVEVLMECGQEVSESVFVEQAILDREHSAKAKRERSSNGGDQQTIEMLRARIVELEKELTDARRHAESRPATADDQGQLSFRYETSLLRLVADTQERYLGDNYDPDDMDSRPRKDAVVAWLRELDSSLSETSAEAVDRVAMPFNRGR